MGALHQNEYPEDEQNNEQGVRVRIPLAGLAIALSLLVGAVAGIVAYRYAATKRKPPTSVPAPVTAAAPSVQKPAVSEKPAVSNSSQPAVQRIDPQLVKGNLQLTITLNQIVPYDAHRLGHPDRVYVDLHGAHLTPELARKILVNKGGVSDIRLAQTQADTVRVVLDLKERLDYSVTQQTNPAAVVLELMPAHRKRRPAASQPKTSPQ
ncbi:MAG: AMIN domain-containing protein [Terriglobales bacterium]